MGKKVKLVLTVEVDQDQLPDGYTGELDWTLPNMDSYVVTKAPDGWVAKPNPCTGFFELVIKTSPLVVDASPIGSEPTPFEKARAIHRVIRSMHDGHCPDCGHLDESDKFRAGGDYMCPECEFFIPHELATRGIMLFNKYLKNSVAIFNQFRKNPKSIENEIVAQQHESEK